MSRTLQHNKHHASLSIEELFLQPRQHTQEWLLTYLDVFVLIIMLVISLIAISDFGTEQKTKKISTLENYSKQPNLQPADKTRKLNKELSSDKLTTKEPTKKQDNLILDIKRVQQEQKKSPLIKELSSDIYSEKEPRKVQKKLITNENIVQEQINSPDHQTQEPTQQIKDKTAVAEDQNKDKYKEDKPKQENQLSDDILQKQLKKTVDQLGLTDSVDLKVTQGYAQLEIQDKILFKSSEAALLKLGESLLTKLIPLLAQSSGLIYIEGHTDNRPIKTIQFPSNWELGAARATRVLHFLASQNLESSRLRAITFGDTKPIADNSTKEGREKNRRVSLVIKISDKID